MFNLHYFSFSPIIKLPWLSCPSSSVNRPFRCLRLFMHLPCAISGLTCAISSCPISIRPFPPFYFFSGFLFLLFSSPFSASFSSSLASLSSSSSSASFPLLNYFCAILGFPFFPLVLVCIWTQASSACCVSAFPLLGNHGPTRTVGPLHQSRAAPSKLWRDIGL